MLRVGVIGAGAWGLNHVRVVLGEPRCALVAVADPDLHALARVHSIAPATRRVRDPHDLIDDPNIDALIIASPAPTHAPLGSAAFKAGKHALIEKPFAMTTEQAIQVAQAARTARRTGMVGHLMVHHPALVRLRELLNSGMLGTLHYLHSTRVNLGRLRRDENALWSFGPHDLSMIQLLIEAPPTSVAARGQSVLQPGIEDVVFLTLRYGSGAMAHVHLSWLSPRKERRLTVVCSQKMAEFDDVATEKLKIYDKGYDRPPEFTEYAQYLTLRDGDVHIPQLVMAEPLRLQLQHFLDCIELGLEPESSLTRAIEVTRILEAAQLSLARDGVPVDLVR
ncbi:MAG: Gfo/Idh/MocA family oxidoreductase [Kofleriaceae bacterium]|nr:Gfo/Idh/MocA family oxidoreductase [Kofleriaceae bacterium]